MRRWRRATGALAAGLVLAAGAPARQAPRPAPRPAPLPASSLAVRVGDAWRTWWRAESAPAAWALGDTALLAAARWRRGAAGIEWTELALAGTGEAWRTRLVVARLDPARLRLALDTARDADGAAWRISRAPRGAALAVNAGQFVHSLPWGWVVLDGEQYLAPAPGPLATALVIDTAGRVRWRHGAIAGDRPARTGGDVRWAFQSYPTLLVDGAVPPPLRGAALGIDVSHRDARAAIGRAADGRLVIALTRFDALGETLDFVPFGLTTPEMAAVMASLGARDAVMLDGGISAQLLVREPSGTARRWQGARAVPLALVGLEK